MLYLIGNLIGNIFIQLIVSTLCWYFTSVKYTCTKCTSLPFIFQISKITGMLISFNIIILITFRLIEWRLYIPKKYNNLILLNIISSSLLHTTCHIYNLYRKVYIVTNIDYTDIDFVITGILLLLFIFVLQTNFLVVSSILFIYHSYKSISLFILVGFYIILYFYITYTCMFYYRINDVIKHNDNLYEYIIHEKNDYLKNKKITSLIPYKTFIPIKITNSNYSILSNSFVEKGSKLVFYRIIQLCPIKIKENRINLSIDSVYNLTKYIEFFKYILNNNSSSSKIRMFILIRLERSSDFNFCLDLIKLLYDKFFVKVYVNINDTCVDFVEIYNINSVNKFIELMEI
jgi:hypothetical protein